MLVKGFPIAGLPIFGTSSNIPTSNKTANVMQTANHKWRHNTGTGKKQRWSAEDGDRKPSS